MSGVSISYGNIAIGAKENATIEGVGQAEFIDVSQLKQNRATVKNYGNPCELYQTVLDGKQILLPQDLENTNLGFWSAAISDTEGLFYPYPSITLTTDAVYTSQGFTLAFDVYNNIYSTMLTITWYRGETVIDTKQFTPNSAEYFCENYVEEFNKVKIEFVSMNVPFNRLRVSGIEYGHGTTINEDELRNVKIIQELNPVATELAISTCDFVFDGKKNGIYSFQQGQPLKIYFNGSLKAETFIKNFKRTSENIWKIESEDYIGVLDRTPFPGGIYSNKYSRDLYKEIFDAAGISNYYITTSSYVSGYIPYTTCRNALAQLCLATNSCIDTSLPHRYPVVVRKLSSTSQSPNKSIGQDRIMQGQSADEEEAVTSVELFEHSYTPINEMVTIYDSAGMGVEGDIFIKFTEPLHSLEIVGDEASIRESGANYAIINLPNGGVLSGKKYEHKTVIKTARNALAPPNAERVVAIENATLVNSSNSERVLEHCLGWLTKTRKINLMIAERKHVTEGEAIRYRQKKYGTFKYGERHPSTIWYDEGINLGDAVIANASYLGDINAKVLKQSYILRSGTVIKDVVLR